VAGAVVCRQRLLGGNGKVMPRRVVWCVGPALACLLDVLLTLHGQSTAYWHGAYEQVLELNPLASWVLQWHPLLFAAGGLVWLAAVVLLIVRLPRHLALPLAFVVQAAHTLGAASWLLRAGSGGLLAALVLLLASSWWLHRTWPREGD
jgi:hypothetical protein